VIAHDRRGHGRSAQPSEGNDMDHYADDLAELTQHLDLHDAVHIGHSAGGGEVARYIGRHGESRVAKAALISAVTPSVLQTGANPADVPQAALRSPASAAGGEPLGVLPSRTFMMGGAKGQCDCVSEFIREDYTDDLKRSACRSWS
jgi:non-heme chloroperoxidase